MLNEVPDFGDQVASQYRTLIGSARSHLVQNYNGQIQTYRVSTPWDFGGAPEGNWHLALGGFRYAQSALVTTIPDGRGGITMRVDSIVHVYDRYDWNEGGVASVDVPVIGRITFRDNDMRALHRAGLGRDYQVRGSLHRDIQMIRMRAPAVQRPPR